MKKEGFLLDIDYITERDDTGYEKPVIRLWCKSKEGEVFVVLDKSFEPYFYAFLHSHFHSYPYRDIEETKGAVEKIRVDRGDEQISVKRVEFCQKKLLGVKQRGLKIYAGHPRHVPLLREAVKKAGLTVLEADILFAIRYLIDKQLRPFDGVNVVGEEIELDYANTAILASDISYKKMSGGGDLPALKILAFDCEMATLSGYGMPSAKNDPITIISAAYTEGIGKEVKAKLFMMEEEGWTEKGDKKVITDFLNFVAQFQPDVIVGYNSDAFDWQYIRERAKMHRIRLTVGADGSTVQYDKERGGALPGVNITGRLNVDLFKLAKRDLDSVKVKKLENVAEYLGVMKKSERVNLTPREITDYWVDASPSSAVRQQLYEYAKADAVSTLGIAEKMLPLQIELSKMIGYPLDEVAKMGRGRQVEAFLTAEAFKKGELVPPKRGAEKTFEGGFVLPPEKGLHENVIALDFSSMYPTIMISFNISPDTFVEARGAGAEPESNLYIAPEVGHAFRKTPDGFFKRIMSDLIARRRAIKAGMKKHDKNSDQYRLLDIQQQSIKILTNSFYGYTGWSAAKFYKRECAEATTAWGRHFIKRTVEVAEKRGFEVIYGDSVMKDTPVLIRKQGGVEIIPVEDLDIAPRTMSGGRREVKGVDVLTENGWSRAEYVHKRKTRKKTYRILTRAGFVEATEDHSFVVNGKEITPKDFKPGDRINLVHYALETKYEVDDDLAWLVGFYIAEGGCGRYETKSSLKYQWKIDNSDFGLLEKCGFILNKFGLNTSILDVRESSATYRLVPSGNIKLFYELFKEWCHTKRGDKKIPGFILEAKRAPKESFLRGLWAGDGGKDKRTKILEISLTDKSVVAGLCAMLGSLGFEYSLGVRRDKENVIRIRIVRNKADKRLASGDVIKRMDVKEANDYVYDVETENHHFCAGVGNVLLHNTDSIFAKLPLTPDAAGKEEDIKAATWEKAREVSACISEELPLELEIQDFFKAIFFTGKKKRYAALTDKGEIIVRGLEVRRGDWCELAKEVQTRVIELILKQKDPDAAMKYAKTVIQDVKEGKISVDKLTIYKTLTRKISSYETKQAHVMAAERALTSSSRIVYEVGSKIPYVIIKGAGKTSDRAFPVDVIERSAGDEITAEGRTYQVDSSYYVQHQLIPVAHRVLQLFGYDLSSFDDMRQKTLGHWF